MSFADAIGYLVADNDPRQRITAIKTAVIERIRATDERAKIEVTDHFNHSFVPDLVLGWPDTSEERSVFLRTSYRSWDLLRDIELLADDRPILMPLAPIEPGTREADSSLEQASVENRTLVTDPYGLEAFDDETSSTPVVTLLSHAILQGGRGVISSRRAHSISEAVGSGFQAAQRADPQQTGAAIAATEAALDSPRASQLNRLLHAVWVGSGAPPSLFPGATGVTTSLDAEALRFILQLPDLDDSGFWDRLGYGLKTERLCQLIECPPLPNLQRLIQGCVHRLLAKACRVVSVPAGVGRPQWEITQGTLTLRMPNHRIHFAPRFARELPVSSVPVEPVTVAEMRRRATLAGVSVNEVKLSNGDSTITYSSEERPDIADDTALMAVEQAVAGAVVVSAAASIGSGERTVRCNMISGIGLGNSSAIYYIAELGEVAVPLLAKLTPSELEDITTATSGDGAIDAALETEINTTPAAEADTAGEVVDEHLIPDPELE